MGNVPSAEIEFARKNGILKCAAPSCTHKVKNGRYCYHCELCDPQVAFKPAREQIVNYKNKAYYCKPAGLMYLYTRLGFDSNSSISHAIYDREKLVRPTISSIEQLLFEENEKKIESEKIYKEEMEKSRAMDKLVNYIYECNLASEMHSEIENSYKNDSSDSDVEINNDNLDA